MRKWGVEKEVARQIVDDAEFNERRERELAHPRYDLRVAHRVRAHWEEAVRIWEEDAEDWDMGMWAEMVQSAQEPELAPKTAKQLVTMMLYLGVLVESQDRILVHVRRWDEVGDDGK